jgi:hypothetical protein
VVRLPLYLWLLVPALIGGGIGMTLAKRAAGPPVREAAAPAVLIHARSATSAVPRLVYRNAWNHTSLVTRRPGLHPLTPSAVGESTAVTAPAAAPQEGNVVAFDTRTFDATPADGTTASFDGTTAPQASDTAAATTTSAPPAPVSTTPIEITGVRTVSLTPFSATIQWDTSEPVSGRISYGLDSPTVWTPADAGATSHVATVDGLTGGMSYRLWVNAQATDGRTASSPFVLTTPSLTDHPTASVADATFLLDGHPTFPTLVWGACSDQFASLLAVGIDTFLGKDCGDGAREVDALGLRGFFVSDAKDAAVPGSVGSFLPDEWDTFLPSTITSGEVQKKIPTNGGGPRFLTLTNHFFSQAAPLPQGRGMYPALIANADVVGFDLYPLENWCRWDDFSVVYDSQRELVNLAPGKPTFQWIEARQMDCPDPTLDPTPQTVRAETWLAIAGGAHAIGYFPKDFSPEIGDEIAREKRELQTLTPALVEPAIQSSADNSDVRVGAREHNGAIYVIAVNASRDPVSSTINVPALGNRSLASLDGTRSGSAANGSFTDTFGPLDVHIYIAAP